MIRAMAQHKAIILSTHILEEVHAVCTRAMIIAKGKVVSDGTPAELEKRRQYRLDDGQRCDSGGERSIDLLTVRGVNTVEEKGIDGDLLVQFKFSQMMDNGFCGR
ncbi:MAG: hypothetical protein R3B83_10745 [Nitrospirales bacterium]|nr:hypothetical protein [Nitrospirales bacterium]